MSDPKPRAAASGPASPPRASAGDGHLPLDGPPGPRPAAGCVDETLLEASVDRIVESIRGDARTRRLSPAFLPDREAVIDVIDRLQELVFPGFYGERDLSPEGLHAHVAGRVRELAERLHRQASAGLRYERYADDEDDPQAVDPAAFARHCHDCDERAARVVDRFLERLPQVRSMLSLDVQAALDGDPAARHADETIFCYPGVYAIFVHRCAHELHRLEVPLVPRMMNEHAHQSVGIDIHPGARIGPGLFIDHGTGVVIGETTVIGARCRIYQGVTLGAASFPRRPGGGWDRAAKRHPTLEDHVTVYAGATILGGDTVIGAGSVVNGGVFVTRSVPPGHVVRGPKVDITLRGNPEMPPVSFDI